MSIFSNLQTIGKNLPVAKTVIAMIAVVGTIIGGYITVENLAHDHFLTRKDAIEERQRQFVVHERIIARQKAEYHETQIRITNIELSYYDDRTTLSERELREKSRLESLLTLHDEESRKAREELSKPDIWFINGSHNPGGS